MLRGDARTGRLKGQTTLCLIIRRTHYRLPEDTRRSYCTRNRWTVWLGRWTPASDVCQIVLLPCSTGSRSCEQERGRFWGDTPADKISAPCVTGDAARQRHLKTPSRPVLSNSPSSRRALVRAVNLSVLVSAEGASKLLAPSCFCQSSESCILRHTVAEPRCLG
jgi:hypothetical protein